MGEWIKSGDSFPSDGEQVLVCTRNMGIMFAIHRTYPTLGYSEWVTFYSYSGSAGSYGGQIELKTVTHWMPIPSRPDREEQQ